MNQKEYDLIAGVIYNQLSVETGETKQGVINVSMLLSHRLEQEYPKTFDKTKFMKAAGL